MVRSAPVLARLCDYGSFNFVAAKISRFLKKKNNVHLTKKLYFPFHLQMHKMNAILHEIPLCWGKVTCLTIALILYIHRGYLQFDLISTLTVVHPDLISLYYNLKERTEEMRAHQMEKVLYISGFQGEGWSTNDIFPWCNFTRQKHMVLK